MSWSDAEEAEVQRCIDEQGLSEVIAKAVSQIAQGAVGCFACYQLGHSASYDPRQDIHFGERLLCVAIDKLKGQTNGTR
jgi:hypothetical protein